MNTTPRPKPAPKHPGGRPRKFQEPSRPVTVTLPERTLQQLAAIDADRARAIARAADLAAAPPGSGGEMVEVIRVAPKLGMLMVPASRHLREIANLRMLEVAPGRYLLALPSGTSPSSLEVALRDKLEEIPASQERERNILQTLYDQCRQCRRADKMSQAEVLFVHMGGSDAR